MKMQNVGPIGKVTGSCTWLFDEERKWSFLIDCGMQQGEFSEKDWNQGLCWPFKPSEIQFVILTHAHIDHCGLIPLLYKKGFKGRVICTNETAEIAQILLRDAVKLGAAYSNADINSIIWTEPKKTPLLGGYHSVGKDLFLRFFRTNHLIGAVSAVLYWGKPIVGQQKSIVFSGDLGPCVEDQEYLPFNRHTMIPSDKEPFNYAVIESTYGGLIRDASLTCHMSRHAKVKELLDKILLTKGTLLLPAFSLGRSQELLFDLHWVINSDPEKYGEIEILLDSPTARKINPIFINAMQRTEVGGKGLKKVRPLWLGKQMFRWFDLDGSEPAHIDKMDDIIRQCFGFKPIHKYDPSIGNETSKNWRCRLTLVDNRAELINQSHKPRVVVASSGSCDGGAVAQWLSMILKSERNIVALTGYCSASSVGGQLHTLSEIETRELRRHNGVLSWDGQAQDVKIRDIKANITSLQGYSGHADQKGLLSWLFWKFKSDDWRKTASKVFIQHGDDRNRDKLENAIIEFSIATDCPVKVVKPSNSNNIFDLG
ncbi:MBL fold metallo-hydrolase [Alishewanella sp. HL-SH05]|uniref:MBL fold metallo-hydrolase n=1 Tax=Alishewanella sp. HL-SH05 TaxID=3461145 RepID=UPI00404272BD